MRNLIILLLISIAVSGYAQTNTYDIILFNKVIGETSAQRVKVYGVETYTLKSDAEATVMFKEQTSSDNIKVVVKQGALESCSMIKTKNGVTDKYSVTKGEGSYSFSKNDESRNVDGAIDFTTTELFFEEPVNRDRVFVERLGEWVEIEHLGDHEYRTKVDGSNNFYTYKDGKMVEMRIKNVVNIYMTLRE